jgi:extradiol dioxygenase family protein
MKYLNDSNRFHLAIAVKSIEESKEFYCDLMGCVAGDYEEGRWQDINFWGNELTLHHGPDEVANKKRHDVDMGTVSVPHFGAHLKEDEFFALKDRIEASEKFNYYDEPYRRFINKDREQETFFIQDPSGNVLEIKTMVNPETLWS